VIELLKSKVIFFTIFIVIIFLIEQPSYASSVNSSANIGINFTRIIASLIFCLFLAVAVILILNKVNPNGNRINIFSTIIKKQNAASDTIKILERSRINQNVELVSFQYGDSKYLISVTNSDVCVIAKDKVEADSSQFVEASL